MAAKTAETPYQRIMRAAIEGRRGVRITLDECIQMSLDDAISTVAGNDWEQDGVAPPGQRARADEQANTQQGDH